ncbi:MAG: hypothetical protein RL642_941 [Bacteroidota bacterium]
MNEGKRAELVHKKRKLLLKLQIDERVQSTIKDYLYFFDFLNDNQIFYEIEYLTCVDGENHSLFMEALTYPPLSNYKFQENVVKLSDSHYVHEKVQDLFPSSLKLRYLPVLENYEKNFGLRSAGFENAYKSLDVENEIVYFFICNCSPVIKLQLNDVIKFKTAFFDLNQLSNDVCIIPLDYRWLIFGSVEDDWGWGKSPTC